MYQLMRNMDGDIIEGVVKNTETNSFIPFDPSNKDYQEYLEWIAKGNTPEVLGE